MKEGAFAPSMTYSMDDLRTVKSFALERGVQVILEVDIPGHAAAWTKGKPEVMADCFVKYSYNINDFALNPTLDVTLDTVTAILRDLVEATDATSVHLGGDEVVYGCWREDASITQYMAERGIADYNQLLSLFVQQVDAVVAGMGGKKVPPLPPPFP
jgi:hexosaminidase